MLPVERYQPERHLATVQSWYRGHGLEERPPEQFPPTGVIVDGCAGAWLMLTDTSIAFISNVVSDPDAPSVRAGEAIKQAVQTLVAEASGTPHRYLWVTCDVPSILRHAASFGGRVHPTLRVITKELS